MRSNIGSSALVRLLAQWAPQPEAAADGATADAAQRLSEWVSAFDAIELQAAQQSIKGMAATAAAGAESPTQPRRSSSPAADLGNRFEQTRSTLVRAICLAPALPNEFTFAPYKRRHFELQRQMEQSIGALREHVQQALSKASPELRQLAVLDAALHKVTGRREQALLPVATALLERRFEQLRTSHLEALQATAQQDDPATWRQPGCWLHGFENEWQQALLAELELRLEPVAGLVEASGCELKTIQ